MATGTATCPEAISAMRLACSSSMLSSRSARFIAAARSRPYHESAAFRHIPAARSPIPSTRALARGGSTSPREGLRPPRGGADGDMDNQVMRPLKLGHDPQHGKQEAQVGRHRRLEQYLLVRQGLDL